MAKVAIDAGKQTIKLGFDVGIGKASISAGPKGPKGELGLNLGPIGKAGVSISSSGPGLELGAGPLSITVGPDSASGFESMTWDFGIAKHTTTQVGCTVTMTKSIIGVGVVETEVWTDPKCEKKLPVPPPAPQSIAPLFGPNISLDPGSLDFKVGDHVYWFRESFTIKGTFNGSGYQPTSGNYKVPSSPPVIPSSLLYKVQPAQKQVASNKPTSYRYYYVTGVNSYTRLYGPDYSLANEVYVFVDQGAYSPSPQVEIPLNHSIRYNKINGSWEVGADEISTVKSISPLDIPSSSSLLSPPNHPPEQMDKGCCAMLKELHEFFQVERIKNRGFEIPNRLQIAGGEGESKYNNWMEITEALIRISDHLGLHPLSVSVADMRLDIEGEQTFGANFASGTQGIQAAMSQLWANNGKADTVTTFLYKLSVLTIQIMLLNCKQSGDLQALKDMIGGKTEPAVDSVRTPLNIAAGVKIDDKKNRGKGFGKDGKQSSQPVGEKPPEFDPAMADPNVLFPEFLKNRDNEIMIHRFVGDKDLYDLLMIVIMKLEKLEYR